MSQLSYTQEEQETICTYDYANNTWDVYTCVRKHITKLTKMIGEPTTILEQTEDGRILSGVWEGLNHSQVSFRKESKGSGRVYTEEERAKVAERFKLAKESK